MERTLRIDGRAPARAELGFDTEGEAECAACTATQGTPPALPSVSGKGFLAGSSFVFEKEGKHVREVPGRVSYLRRKTSPKDQESHPQSPLTGGETQGAVELLEAFSSGSVAGFLLLLLNPYVAEASL